MAATQGVGQGGNDALARMEASMQRTEQFQAAVTEMQEKHKMKQVANDALQSAIGGLKASS
jgi:hypothetical protein